MEKSKRRSFLKKSILFTGGLAATPFVGCTNDTVDQRDDLLYIVGPKNGYDTQIGILLSQMNIMRTWVINSVKHLSVKDLDHQLDNKSNSIGALLMHLAATEKFYQLNTFEGIRFGTWSQEIDKEWGVASRLGSKARETIKGNSIHYYLEKLEAVRNQTKREFAERDDKWLMQVDQGFGWGPTNNYCKWFHVCDHESNHRGQITLISKRLSS